MTRLYSIDFINGHFGDPGVFISFLYQKRAILLDLGEIYGLTEKDILKIERIFITHTHIDHFSGFERLIRIMLGRDKKISLYGPEGFIRNIEGKLAGYNWNLVKKYKNDFEITAHEISKNIIITKKYLCKEAFAPMTLQETPFSSGGALYEDDAITINAVILDHGIECLGFSINEKFRINIIKKELQNLGLEQGRWLAEFKQVLGKKIAGRKDASEFHIRDKSGKKLEFQTEELAEKIALITPGTKIAYISDVKYTKENVEKIISIAKNADNLFIEAVFAEKDRELAAVKNHLTAKQAGEIARLAGAKKISVFHFSPRYKNQEDMLIKEAEKAFKDSRTAKDPRATK